jgi:hypothetical protein
MTIPMHHSQIGGGKVERPFSMGGRTLPRGTVLTREEILAIRTANRSSLIDKGYLAVWPKEALSSGQAVAGEPAERFVIHTGFSRYNVIEGRVINAEPLDKESAHLLAGKPLPANGKNDAAH